MPLNWRRAIVLTHLQMIESFVLLISVVMNVVLLIQRHRMRQEYDPMLVAFGPPKKPSRKEAMLAEALLLPED